MIGWGVGDDVDDESNIHPLLLIYTQVYARHSAGHLSICDISSCSSSSSSSIARVQTCIQRE